MAVTVSVASPVDFDAYGDYAPPPGAYEQRGDMATLDLPDRRAHHRRRLVAVPRRSRVATTSTTRTTARGRSAR